MRNLNKNKRLLHYALRIGEKANEDEYGNETGETTPIYGDPVPLMCSISAATGEDAVQIFGNFTGYNRTLCIADTRCPIDEESIVWVDRDVTSPHNYIVVRKADSKNGLLYALQEVTVT